MVDLVYWQAEVAVEALALKLVAVVDPHVETLVVVEDRLEEDLVVDLAVYLTAVVHGSQYTQVKVVAFCFYCPVGVEDVSQEWDCYLDCT